MKLVTRISQVHKSHLSSEELQILISISPPEPSKVVYNTEVPYEDDNQYRLIETLQSMDLRPLGWDENFDPSQHYVVLFKREYEASDYEDAELLLMCPIGMDDRRGVHLANEFQLGPEGVMLFGSKLPKEKSSILAPRYSYYCHWALIPERLRGVLEEGCFDGLIFDETSVVEGSEDERTPPLDWSEYPERWWRLNSDKVMPKLSPNCTLGGTNGRPFREDFSVGCVLYEGHFVPPEMHYRRSDLEAMGSFDVARTHEWYGGPMQKDGQRLIVSQRFYRYCVDNNIESGWQPVRIDEE